jgi:hypothetical protein
MDERFSTSVEQCCSQILESGGLIDETVAAFWECLGGKTLLCLAPN